jgi:hypothetical protein
MIVKSELGKTLGISTAPKIGADRVVVQQTRLNLSLGGSELGLGKRRGVLVAVSPSSKINRLLSGW